MALGAQWSSLWLKKIPKKSAKRPCDEGFETSRHLRWDPLPPNGIDRIARHVRKEGGRKEGMDQNRYGKGVLSMGSSAAAKKGLS